MISKSVVKGSGRIHASIEKFWFEPKLSEGAFETTMRSSIPSKLNACPTSPLVMPTPLSSSALLLPTESLPLPSAFHQLIKPEETGAQFVGGGPVGHLPAPSAL